MPSGNIASEWEGYGATKVYYSKLPLTHENFELGFTEATTVVASTREWVPGYNIPDGHIFSDYSTVEATPAFSTTSKDIDALFKDDGATGKKLKGNTQINWHEEIRRDIALAPGKNWYDSNIWYISRSYSLKQQIEDKRTKKVRKRYRRHE